jgi:oligopeptide transport system ATP-binding protein
MTSLDPLLSVGYQVIQALKNNANLTHLQARKEAIELLERVGIPNAKKRMKDLPGKYSGGMRQRVVIAIALACKPKILICDEPTTALDVTIQAQILDLIKELKKEYGFTVVFITHDLGVVANIADRVAIVYAGQIIEYGKIKEIYFNPQHPYT